jgi:hypothetical protein
MTLPDDLLDPPAEHPSHRSDRTPIERMRRLVLTSCVVAVLGLLLGGFGTIHSLQSDRRADTNAGHANALATALATANSSIVAIGGTPVSTPTSAAPAPTATVTVSGPAGRNGASGSPGIGPTSDQVLAAVTIYCHANTCGTPPSAAQVAQAVVTYCSAGSCTGKSGATVTGPPGPSGPAGQNGQDGLSASPDQIAQAVADYCSGHANCAGPAGADGTNGANGTSGTDGAPGPPGQGVPSFTFTIPGVLGDTSYTCTAPDYACVSS